MTPGSKPTNTPLSHFDQIELLLGQLDAMRDALDKGRRFERAYQESLGATPTATQWERLDSLQSAFIDAYVEVLR